MTDAARVEKLSQYDWGAVGKTLTAFVIQYMNYCTSNKYENWNFPEGYRAEDIAYKAIKDILDGTRKWDAEKHPDLIKFMEFSVCRSIISNLYSKAKGRQTTLISQDAFLNPDTEDNFEYYSDNQINFGLYFEQEIDNELFLSKLSDLLSDDSQAQDVLLLVLDSTQNKAIAQELGITEAQVSNAKKRIKRAADTILRSIS